MSNTNSGVRMYLLAAFLSIAICEDAGLRHAFPFMVRSNQHEETSVPYQTASTPVVPAEDPTAAFTADACQAVAGDLLQEDETQFSKRFSLRCLSVHKAQKKFSGYGINTDMIVVSARFQLSTIATSTNGLSWTKFYEISETIDAGQLQGLDNGDTVQRVTKDLKQQIQEDTDSLSALRKPFQQ